MPKFDIAGHRRIFFLISLILIIPGFICMGVRGFNFGIDFTGGTIIDLHFEHPVTLADIRTSLAKYDLDNSTIQLSGTESGVESSENAMIRTVDLEENQRKEVMAALAQDVGPYTVLREEKVGATIGGELITNAVLALVISWALIILYVAYRFEWRFGVSAVLALVHDIAVTVGVFAILQVEVSPATVIGFLTILGYSLYDTVVVFDKVRELTSDVYEQKHYTFDEYVNLAVNQTMVRSINTSVVALLPVGAILIIGSVALGPGTLVDISLALFVGMIAGTYSSIFIASPLLVTFQELSAKTREHNAAVDRARQGRHAADTPGASASVKVAPIKPGKRLGNENQPHRKKNHR